MTDSNPATDDEWTDEALYVMADVNAATLADARADALNDADLAALLEASEGG